MPVSMPGQRRGSLVSIAGQMIGGDRLNRNLGMLQSSVRRQKICRHRSGIKTRAPVQKRAIKSGFLGERPGSDKPGSAASLDGLQLVSRRLAILAIRRDLKRDLLPLVQAAETCTLDGADVNKDIRTTSIRCDEPETLLGIEPLHCTCSHFRSLSIVGVGPGAQVMRRSIDVPSVSRGSSNANGAWNEVSRV